VAKPIPDDDEHFAEQHEAAAAKDSDHATSPYFRELYGLSKAIDNEASS